MASTLSPLEALADELLLNITGRLRKCDKLALRVASPHRLAPFLFDVIAECFGEHLTFWSMRYGPRARSLKRQEAILAILESSTDIVRRVTSVGQVFWTEKYPPRRDFLDHSQGDQQELLFRILAALPTPEKLTCFHLNTVDQHLVLEENLARLSPKTSLSRLTIYNATTTSTAFQALLKYAPNLKQLIVSESLCTDGWSGAFKAIGHTSRLLELQLRTIGVGGASAPAAAINNSPHCADGKAHPSRYQKCHHESKEFTVDGKVESCELHTMDTGNVSGYCQIKQAMEYLLRFAPDDDPDL